MEKRFHTYSVSVLTVYYILHSSFRLSHATERIEEAIIELKSTLLLFQAQAALRSVAEAGEQVAALERTLQSSEGNGPYTHSDVSGSAGDSAAATILKLRSQLAQQQVQINAMRGGSTTPLPTSRGTATRGGNDSSSTLAAWTPGARPPSPPSAATMAARAHTRQAELLAVRCGRS